jgi:hypothetical protein
VTKRGCLQTWLASRNAAAIAQLVEHLIRNEGVGGSNPSCGTNLFNTLEDLFVGLCTTCALAIARVEIGAFCGRRSHSRRYFADPFAEFVSIKQAGGNRSLTKSSRYLL